MARTLFIAWCRLLATLGASALLFTFCWSLIQLYDMLVAWLGA